MAFREVSVVQVKEALRRWLRGEGERPIAQGVGIDRKTARRYIAAAIELGVDRSGGEEQLSDELIGQVVERVRPHRPDGHGEAWRIAAGRGGADQGVGERRPHRRQDRHPARPPRRRRPAPHPGPLRRRALRGRQAHGDGAGRRPAAGDRAPGRLRPARSGPRRRAPTGVPRADLHGVLQPSPVRLADVPPDDRGGHPGLRGGLGLLRRGVPGRHPRQHEVDRDRRPRTPRRGSTTPSSSTPSPAASSSTPPGCAPRPTSHASNASSTTCSTTSSPASPSSTWPTAGSGPRPWCTTTAGHAHPRHHPVPARSRRSGPRSCRCCWPCPAHPSTRRSGPTPRSTATSTSRWTRRSTRVPHHLVGQDAAGPARLDHGEALLARRAGQGPSPQTPWWQQSTDPADMPTGKEIYATRDIERARAHGRRSRSTPSASTPRPSWTRRCRGPRCARSTGCSGWSRSGGPSASSRPAPGPSTPRRST